MRMVRAGWNILFYYLFIFFYCIRDYLAYKQDHNRMSTLNINISSTFPKSFIWKLINEHKLEKQTYYLKYFYLINFWRYIKEITSKLHTYLKLVK
jgi:hypothetical protein